MKNRLWPKLLGFLALLVAAGAVVSARMEKSPEAADPARWLPRAQYPFKSRFLEIDGHTVHYIDEGRGPILLFLHGNPTWSFLYRDIIKALSPHYRCIALDYPGFGLSRAKANYSFLPREQSQVVQRFAEKLALGEMTLMVQDWGGPIGLGFAGRRPDLVRQLVIGNTWAWPVEPGSSGEKFSKIMGGPVGRFLIRHFNLFVNAMIPAGVKKRELTSEIMAAYRGPFPTRDSREPTAVFPREILDSADYLTEVAQGLTKIRDLPTLIVWGDQDQAFLEADRVRFEKAFPRHKTVILQGAGHFIQEDDPAKIVASIREFLGN